MKKDNLISSRFFKGFALLLVLLLATAVIYARVGGAGGSSGGGGDSDGIVGTIIYLLMAIPFPWNIIAVAIVIFLFWYGKKKAKQRSVLNQLPTGGGIAKAKGYDKFIQNNPGFDESKFKEKVKTSFVQIQEAWEKKDMSKVRKYISDGMYQRLNTQFKMMNILEQKNTIEKLDVKNIYIDRVDTDGMYDVIHVAIHASVVDKFVSEKYSKLNSGGSEEFVEYWSYLKKRGSQEKDLYNTQNCPSCGAELPKEAGEVAKCEFCNTLTNSGEYDWVLAEITQADDYITSNPLVVKAENLNDTVIEIAADNQDFAVQLLEDKASNAFLQIETARVMQNPELMRRFVSDEVFEKIKSSFDPANKFVYNRIYLNDVTVIGIMEKENLNSVVVSIKYSYQRVVPQEKNVTILDPVVVSATSTLVLSRDKQPAESKGSLYAHRCPSCGSPVGDTIDLNCQYCGYDLNSTKNEWIVTSLMDMNEYYGFYAMNASAFAAGIKPSVLDNLMDVRDYAFNNALIVIAADGTFSNEELDFANKLAKKLGYHEDKIQPMIQMAQQGQLAIKMPENPKMRTKVFKVMEKAAAIDGVDQTEQQLIDSLKQQYPAA